MADDFSDFLDDYEEETPDLPPGLGLDIDEGEDDGEIDQFDQLRRKSARSSSMFDDLELDEEPSGGGSSLSSFSLSNFSPGQRVVLALLVLLDILTVGFGVLIITGQFGF